MEYFSIFIPIILTIVTLAIVKYRIGFIIEKNSDYAQIFGMSLIPTLFSLFIIFIMSLSMKSCNNNDTEYLSYYYVKIRHTDAWNEYIHRTCTRRVPSGRNSNGNIRYRTETYDCSYVENHPERWFAIDNDGDRIYMDRDEFNRIKRLWNVPEVFVDMHRNYYTKDGDAQDYVWDNNRTTIQTYTVTHTYENKVINSQSAFRFRDIDKQEATELGLYDYPEIKYGFDQNPIIGYSKFVTNQDVKDMCFINAYYGKNKQFRTFLLIYPNSSASIVDDQRCYWQGGNKNEFVTCVGIDSITNKIEWVSHFSWLDDITMEVECRDYLMKDSTLNISSYCEWIEGNFNLWKRKEFKDFNYIETYLPSGQVISIFTTIFIINLILFGILLYIIFTYKRH